MRRAVHPSNRELWLAFAVIVFSTLVYAFVVIQGRAVPRSSELFGHGLGIAGFVLMLITETAYSLRKRQSGARWGRMATWLQGHIFTGLVGPFWVLLHTSWKFNGLAGVVTLLTLVVVASGFIGRYIYTAVPRTLDGVEVEAGDLQTEMDSLAAEMGALSSTAALPRLLRPDSWVGRLRWALAVRRLPAEARPAAERLGQIQARHAVLARQIASLALARRMLAVWHAVHIPIGLALFSAAFVHIGAAIYYATLLR